MSEKWDEIKNDIKDLSDENLDEIVRNDNQFDELSKLINIEINKKVKKASFKLVKMFLIGFIALFLILNPLFKLGFVNLKKLDNSNAFGDFDKMDILLMSYFNVVQPYLFTDDTEVEDLGFGKYRIHYNSFDIRESINGSPIFNNYVDVDKNKLKDQYIPNDDFMIYMGRYQGNDDPYKQESLDWGVEKISNLPDSVNIYATISFKEAVLLEDVFAMFDDNESNLLHVNIKNGNQAHHNLGISTYDYVYVDDDVEYDLEYPNILLKSNVETSIDDYKQHFKSSINYLYDSEFNFNINISGQLQSMHKLVNSDDFIYESMGFVVNASREELLELYEENSDLFAYIELDEVKLH